MATVTGVSSRFVWLLAADGTITKVRREQAEQMAIHGEVVESSTHRTIRVLPADPEPTPDQAAEVESPHDRRSCGAVPSFTHEVQRSGTDAREELRLAKEVSRPSTSHENQRSGTPCADPMDQELRLATEVLRVVERCRDGCRCRLPQRSY